MTEAIRIAVANFAHETVTFLPNDTTLDDFVHDGSPASGEALLAWEPRSYMGGFVKVAREHGGVELVGIESPLWPRTGTGSAGSRGRPTSTFSAACSPSSRTAGHGTASISPCTERWACAAWRGPRPTSPAACARSWAVAPSWRAPSIRTAT